MAQNKKNKSNLFGTKEQEQPIEDVGYSEEQEKQDLATLGILDEDELKSVTEYQGEVLPATNDIFSTLEEQKKMVAVYRNQIALLSDRSKMKRAKQMLSLIEKTMDNISDAEVQQRMKDAINTPFDQKMYVDSIIQLSKEMNNLLRLDSINEGGDAGSLAIQLTTAGGTEIKIAAK